MKKDFWRWHKDKSHIHDAKNRLFFHEREVWFCHLGANVGFEQDGKGKNFGRPVIVFKKFNNEVFWGLPLTTRNKTGKFYFPIDMKDGLQRKAILSQLRLLDSKRLYQKVGVINKELHTELIRVIVQICEGE